MSPQRVQIGVAHNCLDYVLPFAYSARYQSITGITVSLTIGPTELTLAALEQSSLDFVITDRMPDVRDTLTTETLYENPLYVVCAPDHPLASNTERMLADLAGQEWLVSSSMMKRELYAIFERAGLPLPIVRLDARCSSMRGHLLASTQLLACHALPTVIALAQIRAHLAVLRVKDLEWTRPIFVVFRKARGLSGAGRRLIDDLKGIAFSETNLP